MCASLTEARSCALFFSASVLSCPVFFFFSFAHEVSRRFMATSARPLSDDERASFLALVHDKMTEMEYSE